MEQLSAMMDGELEEHAIEAEMRRLKSDPQWEDTWNAYHVIGDALRGEIVSAPGVLRDQVLARLATEPTILAPRLRKTPPVVRRVALPLAASLCGIAVVAWLALSNYSVLSPNNDQRTAGMLAAAPELTEQMSESDSEAMNEYLLAHQQFSPSTAMQGVASYVRTVSAGDSAR